MNSFRYFDLTTFVALYWWWKNTMKRKHDFGGGEDVIESCWWNAVEKEVDGRVHVELHRWRMTT